MKNGHQKQFGYRLEDLEEWLEALAGVVADLPKALEQLRIFRSSTPGSTQRVFSFEESAEILGLSEARLRQLIERTRADSNPSAERNHSATAVQAMRRIEAATRFPRETTLDAA